MGPIVAVKSHILLVVSFLQQPTQAESMLVSVSLPLAATGETVIDLVLVSPFYREVLVVPLTRQ